jgi:hypothetical protein
MLTPQGSPLYMSAAALSSRQADFTRGIGKVLEVLMPKPAPSRARGHSRGQDRPVCRHRTAHVAHAKKQTPPHPERSPLQS